MKCARCLRRTLLSRNKRPSFVVAAAEVQWVDTENAAELGVDVEAAAALACRRS